jgi:DNA-binding transcriptional MerR regulator
MTAKRFRVNDLVKYNYSEIGEYIDENHTDRPLRNDELVELLNELHEENQRLNQTLENIQKELNKYNNEWVDL